MLFEAAAGAGVEGIVHFPVANASSEYRLPYFRGKGHVEEILQDMGIPYAIIRPTLVFGEGDLLLNNMAWALRRFRVFPPRLRERRLPGPADLRRGPGSSGGGCRFTDRLLCHRRRRARDVHLRGIAPASGPKWWAPRFGWCICHRHWGSL